MVWPVIGQVLAVWEIDVCLSLGDFPFSVAVARNTQLIILFSCFVLLLIVIGRVAAGRGSQLTGDGW